MLNIDRRVNINACFKKLLDILAAFNISAAGSICVRQLVNQNKLRLSRNGCVNIKLLKINGIIFNGFCRNTLDSVSKSGGLRAGVRLNIACNNINSSAFCGMSGFEHGIGFTDTRGIAEKYFKASPVAAVFITLDYSEKLVGILSFAFHAASPPL